MVSDGRRSSLDATTLWMDLSRYPAAAQRKDLFLARLRSTDAVHRVPHKPTSVYDFISEIFLRVSRFRAFCRSIWSPIAQFDWLQLEHLLDICCGDRTNVEGREAGVFQIRQVTWISLSSTVA